MDKKKIAQAAAALLIALMFLTAYISLSNYSPQSNKSSTTTAAQTYYAQGVTNGIITGYGSPIFINVSCNSSMLQNTTVNNLTDTLNLLQENSSVQNDAPSGSSFEVLMGNMSSYGLYKYISRQYPSTEFQCLNFTGPAYLLLPSTVNMTVGTQTVPITLTNIQRNNTIAGMLSTPIGTTMKVKISTLLTQNGTIYSSINILPLQ